MTSAPASANIFTAAAPIPREPPVIIAALPAGEIMKPPRKCGTTKREDRTRKCLKQSLGFVPYQLAGVAGPLGSGNKFCEQRARKPIARHALGMPLHTDDPARTALPFDGFDGAVGSMRSDCQVFSRHRNGLVMAAVDCAGGAAVKPGKQATGFEGCGMLEV